MSSVNMNAALFIAGFVHKKQVLFFRAKKKWLPKKQKEQWF